MLKLTHPLTGRRYEKDFFDVRTTYDLLLVIGENVTLDRVGTWTSEQRSEAGNYAMRSHLKASDNMRIKVPARPAFLRGN